MTPATVHGIRMDLSRDDLFDDLGRMRLKESYMREEENSPQERFAYVSAAFGSNPEHSQRLYDYSSKHWLSYSTPILSFGRSKRVSLSVAFYLIWMIVLKVWSILYQRSTGSACSAEA